MDVVDTPDHSPNPLLMPPGTHWDFEREKTLPWSFTESPYSSSEGESPFSELQRKDLWGPPPSQTPSTTPMHRTHPLFYSRILLK
ncbi:hypothetical protein CDAR_618291 [Caerostris darwini]|uniref:Uncharacterized protein n=1 Tax=Caerostris darwini TaxID=1538125 RepID=A0AAV4SUR7_9ARAC|nr:hypothetical protein CDAR_618291 [Caerostris darwini]